MMRYALFDHDRRVGPSAPTELEVWKRAVRAGFISDVPVADGPGGQILPRGLHVKRVDEDFAPRPEWNLPAEIS